MSLVESGRVEEVGKPSPFISRGWELAAKQRLQNLNRIASLANCAPEEGEIGAPEAEGPQFCRFIELNRLL